MNVIIVHGSNRNDLVRIKENSLVPQNERHWIPWIKEQLEKRGIKCETPLMPRNWDPKYKEWKDYFNQFLPSINENSVLIGTSTGAAFLVKWLGDTKQKITKLILVAPVTGKEKCNEWLNEEYKDFEIDESIKERVGEIIIFHSDNDHAERLESAKIYSEKLGGELIELKGRGHFIFKHMGTKEFPELLDEILN